ncbi:MAG: hypothetical protein K2M77_03335 [Muribaculaceae bacterium]|nr:hypothetical protein [Muribaculaceae bacterium]
MQLNAMPYVSESLIVERDGKLVALVYPDIENAKRQHLSDKEVADIMHQNIASLNPTLPSYSQIADCKIMTEEFEKTPKRSIKRYLYK